MAEYLGFKEVCLSGDELAEFYQHRDVNSLNCVENEYVIITGDSSDKILDYAKWDGNKYVRIPFKTTNSKLVGKIKPRNPQQHLALDLLYDDERTIKMLGGKFGTGKTFLMCAAACDLLEKGVFDKIVYVRNNIEVAHSKPIGHLPGSYVDKLMPFARPLADHLGGRDALLHLIDRDTIELQHLGDIRGRDIKNAIIMCSEVENMTKEHIQLLIGRVGEGSALWLDGDLKQVDACVFKENSGMRLAIERLAGHHRFGYIKLLKTERSETAAMADLLD